MSSRGSEPEQFDDSNRLTRLEEHVGFAEHTIDQLAGEIAELHRRMAAMARRLESMEERLGEVASREGGAADGPPVEKPPHAAGPPAR